MTPDPQAARGALLLGTDYRALGVARSLGRRGVKVRVLRTPEEPLAAVSRYVERTIQWPRSEDEQARFEFLRDLAETDLAGWALVPTTDTTVMFVARYYAELAARFVHTTPPWSTVSWTLDKQLTYSLAERLGVASPRTAYPGSAAEAAAADVRFPAILKPTVKETSNRFTRAKAWLVRDRHELAARYEEACSLVDPATVMIQELIPGGGDTQFSYAALCREGVPLAAVTARRTRQHPADFGRASTFVETVDCPAVVPPSLSLLEEIGFTGLIEIEYKLDRRDGRYKLLDMNPRVWGWHSLCGRAGVDFSYLLWLLIRGEPIPETTQQDGLGWLRLATDTPTAIGELCRRRLSGREYLRSLRQTGQGAIFASDDPVPGLCELPFLAYVISHRVLRRFRS